MLVLLVLLGGGGRGRGDEGCITIAPLVVGGGGGDGGTSFSLLWCGLLGRKRGRGVGRLGEQAHREWRDGLGN